MSRPVYRRAELSAQYFDIKSANPNFSDVAHAIALTRNVVEEVTAYYEAKLETEKRKLELCKEQRNHYVETLHEERNDIMKTIYTDSDDEAQIKLLDDDLAALDKLNETPEVE